jgi:hypothetical protein
MAERYYAAADIVRCYIRVTADVHNSTSPPRRSGYRAYRTSAAVRVTTHH